MDTISYTPEERQKEYLNSINEPFIELESITNRILRIEPHTLADIKHKLSRDVTFHLLRNKSRKCLVNGRKIDLSRDGIIAYLDTRYDKTISGKNVIYIKKKEYNPPAPPEFNAPFIPSFQPSANGWFDNRKDLIKNKGLGLDPNFDITTLSYKIVKPFV